MTAALELRGLEVRLGGARVLKGADLTVAAGEVVGLVGPNGAGKTSLLRAALGLLRPVSGRAAMFGEDPARLAPAERARRVAYLPQQRRVAWGLTALRVASLGALLQPPRQAEAAARGALARVGMAGLEGRSVLDMSGGERARVLLARLLATEAPLLVVDEPVADLDPEGQLAVLEILRQAAGEGAAVLVTLHELSLAARYCHRLVVMHQGEVVADAAPAEALTPEVLSSVFRLDGRLVSTDAGLVLAAVRSAS